MRQRIEAILGILRTSSTWRDLSAHFGSWQSIYDQFNAQAVTGM
jgi:transposase